MILFEKFDLGIVPIELLKIIRIHSLQDIYRLF